MSATKIQQLEFDYKIGYVSWLVSPHLQTLQHVAQTFVQLVALCR